MKKIIIPLLVLAIGIGLGKFLLETGPEPEKQRVNNPSPVVEVQPLKLQDYAVTINASGTVRAQTQTNLVAEVSGKVLETSPRFQEGGYFDQGDALLRIDSANYQNAITVAEGELAQRQLALEEQQAQAKLARQDWSLFDKASKQQQSDFAARRPHIAAAQANIDAAKAKLEQEKLNLSRTRIQAPYAGRVQEKRVDVGQYVTPGTVLGVIYATDYVEVHLPLSLAQYELLNMPEAFRGQEVDAASLPKVTFRSGGNGDSNTWEGRVVRSSAALDEQSRQINVIARIDKPYEAESGASKPIRIGQYVSARIQGKIFNDVYVVPPAAVRQGKELLLAENGKVRIVPVHLLWSTETEMVVKTNEDLKQQRAITTPLPLATNGSPVEILGEGSKTKDSDRAPADDSIKVSKEEPRKPASVSTRKED
ncbi:MAG: efflux RND transporter periplasmic adaptor subunit [Gammaproteobacteria bacterium]|nr:efflux RND transporter periplasmic adaptor subunit [Gammaproteobacteria bacterium]MBU1723759.1 efflux RND transporter periplasmic adaptor subunit [Gammaproteobacteria bacterium]MBU2004829.1 efflux RND transporter periplasmic adaptor subunit [Gammaproteobacteria bacterium]